MILDLVKITDPVLITPTKPFDFQNPPMDPIQLAKDLTETMLVKNGLGLAANQVGIPYQVFVVKANPVLAVFNPEILDFSEEHGSLYEGCLSWPGLFVKVDRPEDIRIRYTQPNGNVILKTYFGLTARVMQHEYEHLSGGVFWSECSKLCLDMAIKKAKKRGYNYTIGELTGVKKNCKEIHEAFGKTMGPVAI